MISKIGHGWNYSYQQNIQGNFVYRYTNYSSVITKDLGLILFKINLLKDNERIVVPNYSFTKNEISLEYSFLKEDKYLFYSLYCRHYTVQDLHGFSSHRRIIGDYMRALTPGIRISIAIQLCEAFQLLNAENLIIRNFNDNIILFEFEKNKIYFDFLPTLIPYLKEEGNFEKEIYTEYYITAPHNVSKFNDSIYDTQKNNYFLSMILYKLLTGESIFSRLSESEFNQKNLMDSLSYAYHNSCFFADFIKNMQSNLESLFTKKKFSLTRQKPKKANCKPLDNYKSPAAWITHIKKARCVCGHGIIGLYSNALICDECGKEYFGYAESVITKVRIPLVGTAKDVDGVSTTEYFLSMFNLDDQKRPLFRVRKGTDQDGKLRSVLLFTLGDDISCFHNNEVEWQPLDSKNSTGTSLMFEITPQSSDSTFKINSIIIHFAFNRNKIE